MGDRKPPNRIRKKVSATIDAENLSYLDSQTGPGRRFRDRSAGLDVSISALRELDQSLMLVEDLENHIGVLERLLETYKIPLPESPVRA